MKKNDLSIKSKKRIVRVFKAISVIETNTMEIVGGLYAIFNALNQKIEQERHEVVDLKAAMLNKKKQEEFRESWLDKQEVMQLMPVSERTLYTLRKQGDLPFYTFKGKMYFKLSDVEALMKRRDVGEGRWAVG